MARLKFTLLLITIGFASVAQEFDSERVTTWENAGLTYEVEAPSNQILITDFGADNTGELATDEAYNLAKATLAGQPGTIVFPAGDYLFTNTVVVPSGVFIKGESAGVKLHFNLGGSGQLLQMAGSTLPTEHEFSEPGIKGTYSITITDASDISTGDLLRLSMYDEDYMTSSWAYGSLGQVVEVAGVNGNTLILADPLNHQYPLNREPKLKKLNAVRNAGIECISIIREDVTTTQTSNIYVENSFNCAVRNVTSEDCNFSHINVRSSSHITIENCHLHHAHNYGGGGQGYGVVFQATSSFCLAQNNIFNHLRHSMLLQSGANGNVLGYNYSTNPFWEQTSFPTNSAGDAVLHGNYAYMNLFEGNTVQHIVVDASHGKNGPFNTFVRNRAELYGFFSDMSTTTDSMNLVGNEITNSGFPFGNFIVSGNGHYSYGNNHSGATVPIGTNQMKC